MKQWTLQKKIFLKFSIFFFIFFTSANSELIISGKAVITDGDTLNISSNKIRLSGIDAPEIKQTCKKNFIEFMNFKKTGWRDIHASSVDEPENVAQFNYYIKLDWKLEKKAKLVKRLHRFKSKFNFLKNA